MSYRKDRLDQIIIIIGNFFSNNKNLIQPMTVIYPDMLFTVMLALDHVHPVIAVYPETT